MTEYSELEKELRKASDEGDTEASYRLAVLMRDGADGIPRRPFESSMFFKKASDRDHVSATVLLGLMYLEGLGVTADPRRAADLFFKASNLGDDFASCEMGIFYQEGLAMPINLDRAIEYIKKAAANCEPHALFEMGRAREEGRGIRKRLSFAYAWYKAAADQGIERGNAAAERVLRKIPLRLCGKVREYADGFIERVRKRADEVKEEHRQKGIDDSLRQYLLENVPV